MKKILIYINSMNPAGGIERVVSNLSNEWVKQFNIFIVVKDNPSSFYRLDSRTSLITIDCPLKLNMKNRFSRIFSLFSNIIRVHFKLRKTIAKINPNIIYTTNPVNSLEVCLLGKKKSKKLIISEHGSKFGYNNIYNYIKKLVYPRAFKISVPTSLDTRLYLEEGYPAVFIPHISTFSRQEKNFVCEKVILNIGRLTQDKRQIDLLRIWNEIVKEKADQGWRLKIVGRGEEKENLTNYIDANNLNNSVEILEPIKDVDQFFKMASIFAFTSQFEGFGMVLLEAMSFGVPCISFDCPSGPRDIIDDGVNGFLIEDRNHKSYKKMLVELMSNNELRENFSNQSFIKASNWENQRILNQWYELFDEVDQG